MRILLLNPNTTVAMTELMVDAGRSVAGAGTVIVPATAARGFPYISTRSEALIGGAIALEMLAENGRNVDAAIIAAFGDPGVAAARELFDFPVIGVTEAAMLTACMLGQRFAIVTFSTGLVAWYRDCIEINGMMPRCAGIHGLDLSFADVAGNQQGNSDLLVELGEKVAQDSGADCLIFGGAPLTRLAERARDRLPVPVIDPVGAAVKQAEALITLQPRKAGIGSFRRPAPKQTTGLAAPLAAWIEHRQGVAA